jgi:hypothetical protein
VVFLPTLTSLLFHEGYTSIEGCEKITSLVSVSCMKRRKMKALFESFGREKRNFLFLPRIKSLDDDVVRNSIRRKMSNNRY